MSYLGTPYRVVYEAKRLRTGLTDVVAFVMKPDNTVVGPFAMSEMSPFNGRYSFNFETLVTDLAGEYIALIASPTELFQTTARISLVAPPNFDGLYRTAKII